MGEKANDLLVCYPADYAISKGINAYYDENNPLNGRCLYWIMNKFINDVEKTSINFDGSLSAHSCNDYFMGVRPIVKYSLKR